MLKNKAPEETTPEEDLAVTAIPEHYHGMNDTAVRGVDELRLDIAELLQLLNTKLSGKSPGLEAIQAKAMLEDMRKEVEIFEQNENSSAREEIQFEIADNLKTIRTLIELGDLVQKATKTSPRELAEPEKANLIIPPDWENPDKPLH